MTSQASGDEEKRILGLGTDEGATAFMPIASNIFPNGVLPDGHPDDEPGKNEPGKSLGHPPIITTSFTSNSGFTTVLSSNPQPTSSEQTTRDQGGEINQPPTVEVSTEVVASQDSDGQPITSTLVVTGSPVAPSIYPSGSDAGTIAATSSGSAAANSKDDGGQNS